MKQKDIRLMAREAGLLQILDEDAFQKWAREKTNKVLAHFAELIAAHEREECAKLCDIEVSVNVVNASEAYQEGRSMGALVCASTIRARGESK